MKPIKLTLRGFITYKNEIEIDFTDLYQSKVFVISGDTGSGKTTIFDAISFALYGKISRDIPMEKLRSDFLTPADPYTFVNLSFEADGSVYEIERIPTQIAKRSRAGVNIKHSAALFKINGDEKILMAEKVSAVDSAIRDIIGLDQSQFSKVMLLAQGEFQQFLSAESAERTKLLGDIFKTEKYGEIQEKFKTLSKDNKDRLVYIDKSLRDELNRDQELMEMTDSGDIISHNFEAIDKNVGLIIDDRGKTLTEKNKDHQNLSEQYQDLVKKRAEYRQVNQNILRYIELNEKLSQKEKQKTTYNKLKDNLSKAEYAKSIEVYEERLNKARTEYKDTEISIGTKKEELKKLEENFGNLSKDYEKIAHKEAGLDKLKIENSKLSNKLDKIEDFKEIKAQYEAIEKYLDQIDQSSEFLNTTKSAIEACRGEQEELFDSLSKSKEEKASLEKALSELEAKLKEVDEDIEKYKNNQLLTDNIDKAEELIKHLNEKKAKLAAKQNSYERNRKIIQINELIDELNHEGICPVCGSRHDHIFDKLQLGNEIDIDSVIENLSNVNQKIGETEASIAHLKGSLVEVEDIDKLNNKKETISAEKDKVDVEIERLNGEITVYEENQIKIKDELRKNQEQAKSLEEKLAELAEKTANSESLKISYHSQKDEMEAIDEKALRENQASLNNEIEALNSEIKTITNSYNASREKIAELKTSIASLDGNYNKLENDIAHFDTDFNQKLSLEFENFDAYKQFLSTYNELIGRKDEINQYFQELNDLEVRLKDLASYKGKTEIDLGPIDEEIIAIDQARQELNNNISDIRLSLKNIEVISEKIVEIKNDFSQISAESKILDKLSDIANGNTAKVSGREKIDFETFVLTYYFDRVLNFANKRLDQITNGQYSMIRNSNAADKRKGSGLDIEILDAHTGKLRPSSTLSGGESFLASLSLALGLSDEISAENGGITIDTLFIDEGFGTLSDDYLNNVIEQIEKLSYENKFVGLISHVEELKDAIDAKILVTYTSDAGSIIEVVA